jgi:NDP-mannose synthase
MKAVILAGGKGTRLAPYTKILPKPLMPIGDMPILEILIYQLKRAGVDEIILAVGHLAEAIQAYFKDGRQFGVNIRYSFEKNALGTAGPLSLIEGLDSSFLVLNGDVLTDLNFHALVRSHQQTNAAATIAMHKRHLQIDLGVLELNSSNRIRAYVEKPQFHFNVSMGIYVFEPHVLAHIPHNHYFDFPELVQLLIASGDSVMGYTFDGYWHDLGHPDDYEQAVKEFDQMRPQLLGDMIRPISFPKP